LGGWAFEYPLIHAGGDPAPAIRPIHGLFSRASTPLSGRGRDSIRPENDSVRRAFALESKGLV